MTEHNAIPTEFIANVKQHQMLWGLQDNTGEGWVVCDSSEFEDADVMPLWSSDATAKSHCCDEWAGYQPVAISLTDFLEYWVADLHEDGVLIGVDWQTDHDCLEVDPVELAKALVDIEAEPRV